MIVYVLKFFTLFLFSSVAMATEKPSDKKVFLYALKTNCPKQGYLGEYKISYSGNDLVEVFSSMVSAQAKLLWQCPNKINLQVGTAFGFDVITNGSEAWAFYPSRSYTNELDKVEHYKNISTLFLRDWLDLWSDEKGVPEKAYDSLTQKFEMKTDVKNNQQRFYFNAEKKSEFSFSWGQSLDKDRSVPKVIEIKLEKNQGTIKLDLVSAKPVDIDKLSNRVFNPKIPKAKVVDVRPNN